MWSKNIITEVAVDVVWDVSGGGGSTSAIVYTGEYVTWSTDDFRFLFTLILQ